jgi:hypothetical protein
MVFCLGWPDSGLATDGHMALNMSMSRMDESGAGRLVRELTASVELMLEEYRNVSPCPNPCTDTAHANMEFAGG